MKVFIFGTALLLASALPAAAQTLGAGVSFLGDEGGTGITVDYSKDFRELAKEKMLGWVGELSFHHKGFEGGGFNSLFLQGGLRVGGPAAEKLRWHAQGLVGLRRASASGDAGDLIDGLNDLCNELDLACEIDSSDTGLIFTPGVGIDYAFKPNMNLRAQFDLPIALGDGGGSTTRFWIGLSWLLKNR